MNALLVGSLAGGLTLIGQSSASAAGPELQLDKRIAGDGKPVDANGSGKIDKGDQITYEFEATNAGDSNLSKLAVVDDKLALQGVKITCKVKKLAPTESTLCTTSKPYEISQEDVNSGAVQNYAEASATPPAGVDAVTGGSLLVTNIPRASGLTVEGSADKTDLVAGETIEFTYTATNTGTTTISGAQVVPGDFTGDGELSDLSCVPGQPVDLAPNQKLVCKATYEVQPGDVERGSVKSDFTVTGTSGTTPVTEPGSIEVLDDAAPPAKFAKLDLVKRIVGGGKPADANGSGKVDAGDTMRYEVVATNVGNVPLRKLEVTDDKLTQNGITLTCPVKRLPVGKSTLCTTDKDYTIDQPDMDRGGVYNYVSASALAPVGVAPPTAGFTLITPVSNVRSLDLETTADKQTLSQGDTVTYTYTVTNNGDVTLKDVGINQDSFTGVGDLSDFECVPGAPAVLAPTQKLVCKATYDVEPGDLENAEVDNTATATGTPPAGAKVTDTDELKLKTEELVGSWDFEKRIAEGGHDDVDGSETVNLGDTLLYDFLVTNTGNVPVSGFTVRDPLLEENDITVDCPDTVLQPTESLVCEASAPYEVDQDDMDRGEVINTAFGNGTVPDIVDPPGEKESELITPIDEELVGSWDFEKRVAEDGYDDVDGSETVNKGDTLLYDFLVTNTGNVSVTDFKVRDPLLEENGITVDCPDTRLLPNQSIVCTASEPYEIDQEDVDAGGVTNKAFGGGTVPPTVPPEEEKEDELVTPTSDKAAIEGVGTADRTKLVKGQVITFTYTATNTGDVTLHNAQIKLGEFTGNGALSALTCTPAQGTDLAPDATLVCKATYTVLQSDVRDGSVKSSFQVVGTSPKDVEVTDDGAVEVAGGQTPLWKVEKSIVSYNDADESGALSVDDELTYQFKFINLGTASLSALSVTDEKLAADGVTITCPDVTLAPTQSAICTVDKPYTFNEDDVLAGAVKNSANGHATVGTGPAAVRQSMTDMAISPLGLPLDGGGR